MLDLVEVQLFYSGTRNLDVLNQNRELIVFLQEMDVNFQIIDIDEHPEQAELFKIIATPAFRIKTTNHQYRFIGVYEGLKQLLSDDLHGKSILNLLGFKEGRLLAKTLQLRNGNKDQLEQLLQEKMLPKGIYKFKLEIYTPTEAYAEVSLVSVETVKEYGKNESSVCLRITAFLGGIFTELFDKEVVGEEIHCKMHGYEKCLFRIREKKESDEKIKEKILKMIQ